MERLQPPTKEVLDLITKDKADFIEEQVEKMYDFVLESREILVKEAHTTLQWLFALLIGAAGYLIAVFARQYDDHPLHVMSDFWWVVIPLMIAVVGAAHEAFRLIEDALRTSNVFPKGNLASNLTTDGFAEYQDFQMKFLEAWNMQERVEDVRLRNGQIGQAINRARRAVVFIPTLVISMLISLAFLAWLRIPWWCAIIMAAVVLAVAGWGFLGRNISRASG